MPIETTFHVPVPSLPRSVFSLNSLSSPQPRTTRQDSMIPKPGRLQIQKQSFMAVDSFVPLLPDEIAINVDDTLRTIDVFKDGYIYGINETTNSIGIFPSICIQQNQSLTSAGLGINKRLSEALASARSCERTPIDKLGKINVEIGLIAEQDRTRSMLKLGVIMFCILAIIVIIVAMSLT